MARQASFVKTTRCSYLKDEHNYLYVRIGTKNASTRWRCKEFRSQKCPGMARTVETTNENVVIMSSSQHNHLSDLNAVQSINSVAKGINLAINNPSVAPRAVLSGITNELAISHTPMQRSQAGIVRSIQRARKKIGGEPRRPTTFKDVLELIRDEDSSTCDGKPFLRYKDSSAPFSQIYIVHAETENGKVLPAAFALLPNKQSATYEKMWMIIRDNCEIRTEVNLMVDMELAVINAFESVFTCARVTTCFFHFRKALKDQVAKKGCIVEFNNSAILQTFIKMMAALAFVPIDQVVDTWENVIQKYYETEIPEPSDEVEDFFSYFEATFIGRVKRNNRRSPPRFPLKWWNHHEDAIQNRKITNNVSEGYNSAWNSACKRNPSVWTIISLAKEEDRFALAKWREAVAARRPDDLIPTGNARNASFREKTRKI
ncbi:Hypothetical predicted protein, partial [Paramuricea clavata]